MAARRSRWVANPRPVSGEHLEQCKFFQWISKFNHPAVDLTIAIPGAALDTKYKRLFFVREGYRSGCADILIMYPSKNGQHPYGCIEMKFGDNVATPRQLQWLLRASQAGAKTTVVWTADDAFAFWREYLGL